MLIEYPLNIAAEIAYAKTWAYARNPAYYNFEGIGGDCTNFVSQCLHAGGAVMNYTRDTGWYYTSSQNRAAAWTGVNYFYQFMMNNKGAGPFAQQVAKTEVRMGDVIQLGTGAGFYHSLLVVDVQGSEIYIATHTFDAFHRPLSSYSYELARCLHIVGARKYV